MKLKERIFSVEEETSREIAVALDEYLSDFNKRKRIHKKTGEPIIVCVGTDLAIFDALGPLCGTFLKGKMPGVSLYGSLDFLQTALNIRQTSVWLKRECLNRPIIAIDAAVTDEEEEIGNIKIKNQPLLPGTGAEKKLGKVGDITIVGITSLKQYWGGGTRLNMVYSMAEIISNGVVMFLNKWRINNESVKERTNENC